MLGLGLGLGFNKVLKLELASDRLLVGARSPPGSQGTVDHTYSRRVHRLVRVKRGDQLG